MQPPISCASRGLLVLAATLGIATAAQAETFLFDDDPFAGTTALTTPGRQIIGGEPSLDYDPNADQIVVDPVVFGIEDEILLFNGFAPALPDQRFNFIVLRTLDADNDTSNGILLNAGLAADLIAAQLSTPGAGFFVYFNSGLNLPRLVYSTDLSDPTADLKVLARFTSLTGNTDALEDIRDVAVAGGVPEPTAWALMILGFGAAGASLRRRRRLALPPLMGRDSSRSEPGGAVWAGVLRSGRIDTSPPWPLTRPVPPH